MNVLETQIGIELADAIIARCNRKQYAKLVANLAVGKYVEYEVSHGASFVQILDYDNETKLVIMEK